MLSAELRHLVAAAARDAGYPGHERDVGLRDGGAPGRYSSSLPLRLAPARADVPAPAPAEGAGPIPAEGAGPIPAEGAGPACAEGAGPACAEGAGPARAEGAGPARAKGAGPAPADVAATMAVYLRRIPWIEDAQPTGPGYLTITVTPDKLTETAVLVAEAGPASACSDALAGTSHPAPPEAHLTSAHSWAEARDLVAAQVTARLAAAAGATVTVHDPAERTSAALGPIAGTIPPPGTAERTPAILGPSAGLIPPPNAAERTSANLGPSAGLIPPPGTAERTSAALAPRHDQPGPRSGRVRRRRRYYLRAGPHPAGTSRRPRPGRLGAAYPGQSRLES